MLPDLGDVGGRTHGVRSLHRRNTARAFQSRSRSALEAPSLRLGLTVRPPGSSDLRRVARGEVAHWRGREGRRFGRGARRGSLCPAAPGRKPSTARASTFSSTADGVDSEMNGADCLRMGVVAVVVVFLATSLSLVYANSKPRTGGSAAREGS